MPKVIRPDINKIAPALAGLVVPIAKLKFDPQNARLHPERNMEAIKASLMQYGQVKPIVVRKQTGVVIAGNGTLAAAKALGWTKLAVSYVLMTEIEAAGYGLADNRTAELAQWDGEVVRRLETLLKDAGEAPIGWSHDEIMALRLEATNGNVDADDAPPIPKNPITRSGDVWLMGDHRLICGDSATASVVSLLMSNKQAKLFATDPPYGVEFGKANHNPRAKVWDAIKGDNRAGADLRNWLASVLGTWIPHITRDSSFYIWSAPLSEGHRAYEAIQDAGLHIQSQMVWTKNVFALGQADYQWKHEPCWYAFWKGEKHRWYGGRDKTTVWDIKKVSNALYLHPAQKPVELYEIPMLHHTRPGDIVAEPFAGSGTQYIAAHRLGRVCYGVEIDPGYCDVTLQRWATFTGLNPKRQKDGMPFSKLKAAKEKR